MPLGVFSAFVSIPVPVYEPDSDRTNHHHKSSGNTTRREVCLTRAGSSQHVGECPQQLIKKQGDENRSVSAWFQQMCFSLGTGDESVDTNLTQTWAEDRLEAK
ncbi:hypothetical protein Bbelb_138630 [Branchiostoma belcheri]|nr:hypothetical protein Bbelb_138630 [Branchiostoma belcheri]